jgi:hypothetical protein
MEPAEFEFLLFQSAEKALRTLSADSIKRQAKIVRLIVLDFHDINNRYYLELLPQGLVKLTQHTIEATPTVRISTTSITFLEIMLGRLHAAVALVQNKIAVEGMPLSKLRILAPLFWQMAIAYRQIASGELPMCKTERPLANAKGKLEKTVIKLLHFPYTMLLLAAKTLHTLRLQKMYIRLMSWSEEVWQYQHGIMQTQFRAVYEKTAKTLAIAGGNKGGRLPLLPSPTPNVSSTPETAKERPVIRQEPIARKVSQFTPQLGVQQTEQSKVATAAPVAPAEPVSLDKAAHDNILALVAPAETVRLDKAAHDNIPAGVLALVPSPEREGTECPANEAVPGTPANAPAMTGKVDTIIIPSPGEAEDNAEPDQIHHEVVHSNEEVIFAERPPAADSYANAGSTVKGAPDTTTDDAEEWGDEEETDSTSSTPQEDVSESVPSNKHNEPIIEEESEEPETGDEVVVTSPQQQVAAPSDNAESMGEEEEKSVIFGDEEEQVYATHEREEPTPQPDIPAKPLPQSSVPPPLSNKFAENKESEITLAQFIEQLQQAVQKRQQLPAECQRLPAYFFTREREL